MTVYDHFRKWLNATQSKMAELMLEGSDRTGSEVGSDAMDDTDVEVVAAAERDGTDGGMVGSSSLAPM